MEKTALLVIDFINDIVHPEGKIASAANFIKEKDTIKKVNQAINLSRHKNILPIFVKVGFSSSYLECAPESPLFGKVKELNALQLNTWGTEFYEQLEFQPTDLVVVKHRVNAFYSSSLEAILRANKVNTLLICGVATNMTVSTTARDAHDRDYRVIIIEDACAAATDQIHNSTIDLLSRVAQIVKVNDLKNLFT